MDVSRDRNLLFGVFAVQLRGVLPEQLVDISAAWSNNPSVSVAQRMVDKKLLTPDDRAALEKLVDDAVRAHGGDSGELLALFGGEEHVEKLFFGSGTSTYLDHVDTAPMEGGSGVFGGAQGVSGVNETPGRYTLVSHHAKGGMGRVLIVHDEHLGRNIALKELMPAGTGGGASDKPTPIRQSAALISRFLQEARITSQLEHPAIVPVYELGRREDGTLYYTMRLVRGKTFAAALRECGGLDARLALLSNFVSLCQAIAYAHSRGIIHRDIKPANVMLGQFGETVVLDWGLAKLRGSEDIHVEDIKEALSSFEQGGDTPEPMTAYGRALGTPHYMPPEQAAGQIEAIDERSDVYSLGAVLYEMLTGTTPHSGRNTREIIEKVLHESPVPVLQAVPDAPPELAVICEKALNRDAAGRYQTAAELAAEVERFVQGSLVRSYRYSLRQILAHHYAKHRPLVNTVLACVAVLLVTGIASYVSILNARNREHEQRLAAETARQNESVARADAERKTYQSQVRLVQAHIAGRDYGRANETLWETAEKERGWEWGYLLNRANPDVYTLEIPDSDLFAAVFSPDGKRIGTNTCPEPPSIHDALTGKKLVAMEDGAERYSQTAFSPDGTKYMGVSWEGYVNVWDAATGKRLHRFPLNAQGYCAAFDIAGNFIFAGAGDRKVHAFDLQSGAPAYELNVDAGPVVSVVVSPKPNRLLATAPDGTGQLWDLVSKAPVFPVRGQRSVISQDGSRIANVQDTDVVLWDAESGVETARLKGHTERVFVLRFSGDGKRLLSGSLDGTVLLWDVASAKPLQTYRPQTKSAAVSVFFVGEEDYVLVGMADNQCALFDTQTGSCITRIQGRGQELNLADLQPRGALLAMATDNHVLQVVNPLAPAGVETVVASSEKTGRMSYGLSSSASGKLVAFQRDRSGEAVYLVDTEDKLRVCSLSASFGCRVGMPQISEDASRLALVADGRVAAVVADPASARPSVAFFTAHTAPVSSLALRTDGTVAASGDEAGEICLWNAGDAQTQRRWKAHDGTVTRMQFSRDGQRLLSCGLDGQILVWSCGTGEMLVSIERQKKGIAAVAFNGDETRLLTIDMGGVVKLWDAARREMIGKASVGPQMGADQDKWMFVEACFWPVGNQFLTQYPDAGSTLWDPVTMAPLLFFDPEERVLPQRAGQCLAVADRFGNLHTTRMPGTPGGPAPTRPDFQQSQTEWASRSAVAAPKGETTTCMFISREDVARGLDGLMQQAAAPPQDGQARVAVEAASRTQAMAAMGLNAGDRIAAVNDTPLADSAAAKAALQNAAERLAGDPKAGLLLSVLRNGQARRHVYWTLPLTREDAAITMTRSEALALVQQEIDLAPVLLSAAADSAWLSMGFLPEDAADAKVRLAGMMALSAMDGMPCNSIAELQNALLTLKQRIADGGAVQFSQTFRQGAYRELVRSFTVQAG